MYLMWVQKLIWLIRLKSLILSHAYIRVKDKLHISCVCIFWHRELNISFCYLYWILWSMQAEGDS